MALYQTGAYQVKPTGVNKVKKAIAEFVKYVQENEAGSEMYLAWQQQDDPTKFVHLFIVRTRPRRNDMANRTRCDGSKRPTLPS